MPNQPYPFWTVAELDSRRLEARSEEHTSELQSPDHLVCRLLLEKKKNHAPRSRKRAPRSSPHRSMIAVAGDPARRPGGPRSTTRTGESRDSPVGSAGTRAPNAGG